MENQWGIALAKHGDYPVLRRVMTKKYTPHRMTYSGNLLNFKCNTFQRDHQDLRRVMTAKIQSRVIVNTQ